MGEYDKKQHLQVKIWVSDKPVENHSSFFVSNGRRIHSTHQIKSFMKSSKAAWSVWNHPNIVGYIEVGTLLQPVITRDEFVRSAQRTAIYKKIVKTIEPLLVEALAK